MPEQPHPQLSGYEGFDPMDRPPSPLGSLHEDRAEIRRLKAELAKFADWLERDSREPDKVLCVVQSMRRAAR